jgi:hypothetical protein
MTQSEALAIMQTGKNVFLTGEPGSGKTHTVNEYVAWLREHNIEPAVAASTGIASTHIGGMTIHSWCGIGVRDSLTKHDLKQIAGNKRVVNRVKDAHILIIDEVSMLSAKTLDAAEAAVRAIRENEMPFGGLQVIFVGDFFQLPPIVRRVEVDATAQNSLISFEDEEPPSPFAFASHAWSALEPHVCYLSEQHRQEDPVFLELLSAVRAGKVSEKHHRLLHGRHSVSATPETTKLFSHNVDVDRVNLIALEKLPGELHEFPMTSHGAKNIVETLKRGCLSPEMLALKIGARVMFTKNDMNRRFVNGTTGTVVGFKNDEEGCPIVETTDGKTIVAEPVEWTVESEGRILARVAQFPLRLAWAITVHKSQGMSLDAAHMDLSAAFEYGQGYVALSRLRTLAGLSLAGFNHRALEVHPNIAIKDVEFRRESEAAQEELANTAPDDLRDMQDEFIKACGGRIEKRKKEERDNGYSAGYSKKTRVPRWTRTLELVLAGKSLEAMADDQGRVPGTILSHLEELLTLEKITLADIAHLAYGKEGAIAKAHEAFKILTPEHLKPVYEHLHGKVPYDTLHLARLLYREKEKAESRM